MKPMPLQRFDAYTNKASTATALVTPDVEEIRLSDELEPAAQPGLMPPEPELPVGSTATLQPSQNFKITINVEVLEGKIIKFDNVQMKDIYEALNSKYADSNYFLRKKGNDIHIVKFNEELKLDVNRFVDSLFKFYGTTKNLTGISQGVKIKGNAKFSVIEKLNPKFSDKVLSDIVMLLSKKG